MPTSALQVSDFSTHTKMCKHYQNFRTFSSPQKGTLYQWAVSHPFPPRSSLTHPSPRHSLIYFLSLSICLFCISKFPYYICLAFVIQHNFFKVHSCWSVFIPTYSQIIIIFHFIYISHFINPCIHWCTFGLFLFFFFFTIMNNAAVNTHV